MKGEQSDTNQSDADQWILEKWPKLIEMYSSDDVFNADEMGLQISCVAWTPEHTFLFQN